MQDFFHQPFLFVGSVYTSISLYRDVFNVFLKPNSILLSCLHDCIMWLYVVSACICKYFMYTKLFVYSYIWVYLVYNTWLLHAMCIVYKHQYTYNMRIRERGSKHTDYVDMWSRCPEICAWRIGTGGLGGRNHGILRLWNPLFVKFWIISTEHPCACLSRHWHCLLKM